VSAKDIGLALIREIGLEGANYQAIEFNGPALAALTLEDRMVLSNLTVEMGAKAGIFPFDAITASFLADRSTASFEPVFADAGAAYSGAVRLDLETLVPQIALPHAPDNVTSIEQAAGTPVHMVFIGTCTGGRVQDFHEVLDLIERAGNRVAPGVQLVLTPASREVHERLTRDGTLGKLEALGAIVTTTGCGACCGTSGVIPRDGMNVISTANRNFQSRMGNPTASIFLASPGACAAAAVSGRITDPRSITAGQP
jgi:3-isopropylmalate/(R)-2-methylmalate dehydratase large subunit